MQMDDRLPASSPAEETLLVALSLERSEPPSSCIPHSLSESVRFPFKGDLNCNDIPPESFLG